MPAAIKAAAGASTAVIICHEDGALERSSASGAACWRSLALGMMAAAKVELVGGAVVVVEVVVVLEVVVVVEGFVLDAFDEVGVIEDGLLGVGAWLLPADADDLVAAGGCCWVFVSFELRWPKLAASLLLISETAPFSAGPAARTVTNLTRPRLVAVGVDLITRRRILFCCWGSCWPDATMRFVATSASDRKTMNLMVAIRLCLSLCEISRKLLIVELVVTQTPSNNQMPTNLKSKLAFILALELCYHELRVDSTVKIQI